MPRAAGPLLLATFGALLLGALALNALVAAAQPPYAGTLTALGFGALVLGVLWLGLRWRVRLGDTGGARVRDRGRPL